MLRSRVFRRVVFTPLTGNEVVSVIGRYHRIYEGVDPALIRSWTTTAGTGTSGTGRHSPLPLSTFAMTWGGQDSTSRSPATRSRSLAAESVPPEPRVFVVDDEDDDPHLSDQVEAHAGMPGVIVVRPVPGVANLRQLAIEVLIALGKHYDALARERQGARPWRLAWLWVRAEQFRHVVVFYAQRLAPPLWHQLETAAAEAGSTLWLIPGRLRARPGDVA